MPSRNHRPGYPDTETLRAARVLLQDCPSGAARDVQRFRALAYSGAVVERSYGLFAIDLSGIQMKDRIPMLLDHDGTQRVGFADKRFVTDEGLELEGVLSKSTEAGREVASLAKEGFPWELSVGVAVLEREEVPEGVTVEVNGQRLTGPVSIARKCKLREVSFLYSGADASTHAVALASQRRRSVRESLAEIRARHDREKAALAAIQHQASGAKSKHPSLYNLPGLGMSGGVVDSPGRSHYLGGE